MSPMNRSNYPENWRAFSLDIRWTRAKGLCECTGECGRHKGRCARENGRMYPASVDGRDARCVLTVAHLNAKGGPCSCEPRCAIPEHVKAMCQGCHLIYDLERHMIHASENRDKRRGQLRLPLDERRSS